jgi:hypothetical protein
MIENFFSKKISQGLIKKKILIYFTLELIKSSKQKEIANLKDVIKKKEETKESEKDFEQVFGDMLKKIELIKKIQEQRGRFDFYSRNNYNDINLNPINDLNRISNNFFQRQIQNRQNSFNLNNAISRSNPILSIHGDNPNFSRQNIRKKSFFEIPDINLPRHLEYLKPTIEKRNFDLLKINPLINDPKVREIFAKCNDNVMVKGYMGMMPSTIYLTTEDVINIIILFSKYSKIPLNEGIYKVVLGDLMISCYVDKKNQDYKFKIKKMG